MFAKSGLKKKTTPFGTKDTRFKKKGGEVVD
jgi:hypothetical protein